MRAVVGRRSVATWLFMCAGFVLAMVVVGGLTRLTRSGLSIVDWKPITGVLPPLSHDAWLAEFARYQQSPEGRLVNTGMDLAGFQRIFCTLVGGDIMADGQEAWLTTQFDQLCRHLYIKNGSSLIACLIFKIADRSFGLHGLKKQLPPTGVNP